MNISNSYTSKSDILAERISEVGQALLKASDNSLPSRNPIALQVSPTKPTINYVRNISSMQDNPARSSSPVVLQDYSPNKTVVKAQTSSHGNAESPRSPVSLHRSPIANINRSASPNISNR